MSCQASIKSHDPFIKQYHGLDYTCTTASAAAPLFLIAVHGVLYLFPDSKTTERSLQGSSLQCLGPAPVLFYCPGETGPAKTGFSLVNSDRSACSRSPNACPTSLDSQSSAATIFHAISFWSETRDNNAMFRVLSRDIHNICSGETIWYRRKKMARAIYGGPTDSRLQARRPATYMAMGGCKRPLS